MTSSEIIALVAAGYSKADIEAMSAAPVADPQPAPAPAADPAPAPDPAPAADPQTAPDPAPAADPPTAADDRIAVLERAIVKLTQAIQGANILNSGGDPAPAMTAEEALGSLITKKGGK